MRSAECQVAAVVGDRFMEAAASIPLRPTGLGLHRPAGLDQARWEFVQLPVASDKAPVSARLVRGLPAFHLLLLEREQSPRTLFPAITFL